MVTIRPLSGPADARLCAQLMSSSEPWLSLGRTFDESLALVSDPSREIFVAWDGETFRGFIALLMHGAFVGYIQLIAVAPDARSSGVGSQLMAFAESHIFARFPNVFLCVTDTNVRARALYERLGYELIGELKDYLVRGKSEFLMRKTRGPIRESR